MGALWSGMRVGPVAFGGGGFGVGRVVFAGRGVSESAGGCPGRGSVVERGFWCRFFFGELHLVGQNRSYLTPLISP